MPVERPLLTKDQVAQAESRIGFTHPVLTVIEYNLPAIVQLAKGYSQIIDNQEQQRYIRRQYGFLADAIVEVGSYTLEPTDLIAIWSRAREVFSGYHRYALAGMVSSAFAVQGAENPEWRKFPRHYLETSQLPEGVARDQNGLLDVCSKLNHIRESLGEISFYVNGTRESAMSHAFELAKRGSNGDKEAEQELETLIAHQKAHTTPTLAEIYENFGNGFTPLYFPIQRALEAL